VAACVALATLLLAMPKTAGRSEKPWFMVPVPPSCDALTRGTSI
jgi:hypothetical protein